MKLLSTPKRPIPPQGDARRRLRLWVRRLRRLTGWALVLCTLGFVLGNLRLFTPASFRRIASYAMQGLTSGSKDRYRIDYPTANFTGAMTLDGALVTTSGEQVAVQKPGGALLQTIQLPYQTPSLDKAGDWGLLFDRMGKGFATFDTFSIRTEVLGEEPILTASVSTGGYVCAIKTIPGYKNTLFVYSPKGEQIFKWSSAHHYLSSAQVSPSGKILCVAGYKMEGFKVDAKLFFYRLNEETLWKSVSLGDAIPLRVRFLDATHVGVVCDSLSAVVSTEEKTLWQTDYTADDLRAFSFGEGQLALVLREGGGQSALGLHLIDAKGKHETLPLAGEVRSLACSADGVAVLTTHDLQVLDHHLKSVYTLPQLMGVRKIVLGAGHSVFALYPKHATIYTPTHLETEVLDANPPTGATVAPPTDAQ